MKGRAQHLDYLNSRLDCEMRVGAPVTEIQPLKRNKPQSSPHRLKSSDSFSLSITQKDSNNKVLPDLDSNRKSHSAKHHYAASSYNPNLLNDQLFLLQSKLSNLEEKFLSMNTPDKQRPKRSKGGQFRKSHHANTKSFMENKKCNDNTVKRREGVSGKIQPTTRFSLGDQKHSEARGNKETVASRQIMDDRSVDSLRSIDRSKDKQIHQLRLEVSRCKNSSESSRVKKQRVEKEVAQLKEKIAQYKILERRQKEMISQNQRLMRALQKSEIIREKQKQMLQHFKLEIKQLKDVLPRRKF